MVKRLLYLNGLAIIAVILFHANGWGLTALFSWSHRYLPPGSDSFSQFGTPVYYILRAIEQFAIFSIPAFLFVSGFFVAIKASSQAGSNPWKSVGNRIKFLAIPYFVWTTFFVILNLIEGKAITPFNLVFFYLTGSITPAYYFVILLIQFYLLSPWLVQLARTHWKSLLIVTGSIQLVVNLIPYVLSIFPDSSLAVDFARLIPKWIFLSKLFWFGLGVIIGTHRKTFTDFLFARRKWWPGLTILFYLLGIVERELLLHWSNSDWIGTRETPINALYAISFLFLFLSATNTLWKKNEVEKIGAQSLGIYFVHIPVMELVARAVYHLFPQFLSMTLLFVLLIAVTGLLLPLLFMKLFKNSPVKNLYGYVFG